MNARFLAALLLVALAPPRLTAQRLAALAAEQHCEGQVIGAIEFVGARRQLLGPRFDPAARIANRAVLVLQPATRVKLLARFLVLAVGDRCDEQRRVESERVLRAQSYISDVVVRVLPRSTNEVLLRVETIDEYVLYFESWGWSGLPAGLEVGTGSIGGTGKAFRVLGELGRGSEVGWGASYTDPQLLGRLLVLNAKVRSRPYGDVLGLALDHPFYTNFQRIKWHLSADGVRGFSALRDTSFREIAVEYERRTLSASIDRRLGAVNAPWHVGAIFESERAKRRRVVQIRENGTVDIEPPPEVATRYPYFDATRVGLELGYQQIRFRAVRGLGALSAAEDVTIGHASYVGARVGLAALQREPVDQLLTAGSYGGFGDDRAIFRWTMNATWISARPGALPGQTSLSAKAGVSFKQSEAQLTSLSLAGSSYINARTPTQLSFRDDETGLLGYRSINLGGASRVIVAFEERHRIALPTQRVELALAALSQAGRLWANDAPFGVSTPWEVGVGVAAMVAFPAGAKQMLRVEFGIPLTPPPGMRPRELRIFYSDRTGRF